MDFTGTQNRLHDGFIRPMLGRFGGMAIHETPFATSHTHDAFDPIPYSPHRSKRIWKKLAQRQRQSRHEVREPCAYVFDGKMIMHPELTQAMRVHLTNR